jgi:hypothetical protein
MWQPWNTSSTWRMADANWSRTASQTYHLPGVMERVALAAVAARRHMLRGTRQEPQAAATSVAALQQCRRGER